MKEKKNGAVCAKKGVRWEEISPTDERRIAVKSWQLETGTDQYSFLEYAYIDLLPDGTYQIQTSHNCKIWKSGLKTLSAAKRWVTKYVIPNLGSPLLGVKCRKGYEIQAMHCNMGWYLGTCDKEGLPNCCLTHSYAPTMAAAKGLVFTREREPENLMCNRYGKCIDTSILASIPRKK